MTRSVPAGEFAHVEQSTIRARRSRALVRAIRFASVGGALLAGSPAAASDIPVPVRVYMNKPGSTKLVARGTFALPDPNTDNPVSEGGSITFTAGGSSETIPLAPAGWSPLGSPPGTKGFKFRDPTGTTCRKVLVKGTTITAVCRPTEPGTAPYIAGTDAPISIVLSIGNTQHYCAECPNGGVQNGNSALLTKLKDCHAPPGCPAESPTPTDTASRTATATPTATAVACGVVSQGTCGGACPAGQVCGSFGAHTCGCVTAGSCGGSFPACDGMCPAGEACIDPDGTGCLCVGGSCGAYPACGGSCPGQSPACLQFSAPNPALNACVCISAGP